MRSVGVKVPVEMYLKTAYRPDCEYVDGEIVERNGGEKSHSRLQSLLIIFFGALEKRLGLVVLTEQRVQVKSNRFRIPDVCVERAGLPWEEIITRPPLLCIEILSPEDRMAQMQQRVDDYLDFGVPLVWILNPISRKAFKCTREGIQEVRDGILRVDDPPIELPVAEFFSQLG